MIEISCPHCGPSKEVDPAKLPKNVARATCPRCKQNFELTPPAPAPVTGEAEPAIEPAPVAEPLPEEPPASQVRPRQIEVDALPKAGFWIRVVATLIDGGIVFVLQLIFGGLLALAGVAAGNGNTEEVNGLIMLFGYVLSFAYYVFFTGYCGQTPGKMALRIKVIRRDGSDIGYGRAAFREIPCKFISGILFGIGYLMVAFDEQKQGLHDRMADTYVIKL